MLNLYLDWTALGTNLNLFYENIQKSYLTR
jgi:dimeric dUTPase (all-alpha-NTP-PPase superfamily)